MSNICEFRQSLLTGDLAGSAGVGAGADELREPLGEAQRGSGKPWIVPLHPSGLGEVDDGLSQHQGHGSSPGVITGGNGSEDGTTSDGRRAGDPAWGTAFHPVPLLLDARARGEIDQGRRPVLAAGFRLVGFAAGPCVGCRCPMIRADPIRIAAWEIGRTEPLTIDGWLLP